MSLALWGDQPGRDKKRQGPWGTLPGCLATAAALRSLSSVALPSAAADALYHTRKELGRPSDIFF